MKNTFRARQRYIWNYFRTQWRIEKTSADSCITENADFNRLVNMAYYAVSLGMHNSNIVLLWSRLHCSRPFRPGSRHSPGSTIISWLLLLCGDVELKPGLNVVAHKGHHQELRFSCINAWSAINKTAIIHSTIDEKNLNVLAITVSATASTLRTGVTYRLGMWNLTIQPPSATTPPDGYIVLYLYWVLDAKTGWWNHVDFKGIITSAYHRAGEKIHIIRGISGPDDRLNKPPQHLHYLSATVDSWILQQVQQVMKSSWRGHIQVGKLWHLWSAETSIAGDVFSQVDHHVTQVLDDYDLLQHVNVPTHIDEGIMDLIITSPINPRVPCVHVEDMGFPDYFVIISTIASARPDPVSQTCETRYFKAMDLNAFH